MSDPLCVWTESVLPSSLEVRQVYVFVFSPSGRVAVLRDCDHCFLPGGKPEVFDEDMFATARRESLEEASIIVGRMTYLGYVDVTEGVGHYAQVRLVGSLEEEREMHPDPAAGRTYERFYLTCDEAIRALDWGTHGEPQVRAAFREWSRRENPVTSPS